MDLPIVMTFSVFVIVVLQIVTVAILARVFASKRIERTVREIATQLRDQTDRQSVTLGQAVAAGTQAAHDAYDEANTINRKLEHLGMEKTARDRVTAKK